MQTQKINLNPFDHDKSGETTIICEEIVQKVGPVIFQTVIFPKLMAKSNRYTANLGST